MKFFLISDNTDTQMGMRLAGIEGIVVSRPEEVTDALEKAKADKDIGVVLMTEKLINMCKQTVYDMFSRTGRAEFADESMIHCIIGVSGSSPAYTYMYIDALAQAAQASSQAAPLPSTTSEAR